MRLLDDIIGKEIIDSSANILGKVKDIEIDTSINKINFIIVTKGKSNKKFGSSEEEKIPFEMINQIGDKIILKDDLLDLQERINL
ncbi:MAG: photosystem reaction center subunit H [Methanosphaera sp. rholeuAM6]|nr:MAG: photosystem reaction center subunit H [Methanosphaera sp. rholeuAM6]